MMWRIKMNRNITRMEAVLNGVTKNTEEQEVGVKLYRLIRKVYDATSELAGDDFALLGIGNTDEIYDVTSQWLGEVD